MTNREWLNTLSDEDFVKWLFDGEEMSYLNPLNLKQPTPRLETLARTATSSKYAVFQWLKEDRQCH